MNSIRAALARIESNTKLFIAKRSIGMGIYVYFGHKKSILQNRHNDFTLNIDAA